MAAHHRVHDYACCHLQADCLESGISSGPLRSITSMGYLCLLLILIQTQLQPSDETVNVNLFTYSCFHCRSFKKLKFLYFDFFVLVIVVFVLKIVLLANVNSHSRSPYVIASLSVCRLSSVGIEISGIPGSRTVFQSRNPGIMRDQIPGFRD